MKSYCENCGWEGEPKVEFPNIPDLLKRLDVMGEVPSGECPECGFLCYQDKTEGKKPDPAQVYYLANQGARCPFCHSNNIEAGTGEINAGDAFQKVVCNDCEKEWTDEYKLVGFSSDQGGEV